MYQKEFMCRNYFGDDVENIFDTPSHPSIDSSFVGYTNVFQENVSDALHSKSLHLDYHDDNLLSFIKNTF